MTLRTSATLTRKVLCSDWLWCAACGSGESMENALRACCKGIKIGKILIHREGDNGKQVLSCFPVSTVRFLCDYRSTALERVINYNHFNLQVCAQPSFAVLGSLSPVSFERVLLPRTMVLPTWPWSSLSFEPHVSVDQDSGAWWRLDVECYTDTADSVTGQRFLAAAMFNELPM